MPNPGMERDGQSKPHPRDCAPALNEEAAKHLTTDGADPAGRTNNPAGAENKAAPAKLPVVLLTGFEPFDGNKLNSSWEAAKQLDGQTINGAKVVARQLPVVYATAGGALTKAIDQTKPSIVILVGQRGGSSELDIENTAQNMDWSFTADNAGEVRSNPIRIINNAPEKYSSTLPVAAIVKNLKDAGIKAGISQSAGNFLCNHEFYLLEHRIATSSPNLRGGFVHVPKIPEQLGKDSAEPSMPLKTMVQGLKSVIATSVEATVRSKPVVGKEPKEPLPASKSSRAHLNVPRIPGLIIAL